MPTLSLPTWTLGTVDSKSILPSQQIMYSEMQGMMSQVPVDRIQIPDDNGELRKDTMMIEEMKAASQKTLDALFEAWRQLRNITSQHKPSLEKRWRKKTEVQRRAILNKVCPGIPAIHRPDLLALREEFRTKELPFSLDIALRFPYINLEDLSKPEAFLLFLESRSNNFPALFSNTDRSHIRVGIRAKMIVPDYVRGYTMYMNGEQTRETYGRIVSWKQDRQSLFKCHSGVAPDPGIGLVILRIQRDILQFLVRCSAAIMHDIPTADLINGSEQALPDPSTHQVICQPSIANIDSLSVHMLEAPYRLPDMFNFARLRSLIRARRCEVEDHFVSIREDPGCFAEVICAASVDVRQTRMDGRPQARAKTDSTWNTAVSLVLGTAYYDVFRWEAVSYLCNGLMIAYEEEKESIQPGKTLPNAFVRAFSPLDFPPENPTVVQFGYLPYYRLGAPSFKKHTDPTLSPSKTSQKDDYLFWLFKEMLKVQSDKQKAICGLHSLLQENEIFITRKLEEKARLTPGLTRMISELSGVAEMQRELSLSSCNEYSLTAMPKEDIIASVNPRMIPLGNIQKVVNENSFDLASTVKDLRLFDYPSDKTRTAATTAKMRSAEQALDHFWERVNQHFVSKTGKTLKELEEDKIVHRNIERNATVGRDAALVLATLEELTESTIENGQTVQVRQKVKTRYPAALSAQTKTPTQALEHIDGSTENETSKVKLKKKAYKAAFPIFAKVFGKPVTDELTGKTINVLSGKIPWHQFITAMSRAGFGAEKMQGSCWVFHSGERSIIFHEPHPEGHLSTHLARRIARRLNRNFGWTADSFVLDGAAAVEGGSG